MTKRIEWMQLIQYVAVVRAAKRKLAVAYQLLHGEWLALALETDGNDAAGIFASHAAQSLGTFKTQAAAQRACEKFAKNWNGLPGMKKCCGPTVTPDLKRRRAAYRATRR